MGNIVGESLPVYVGDQIEKRQEIYGSGIPGNDRGLKEISYLNSRTAWVKLASGVSIGEKRFKLLKGNPMTTNIVTGNDLARNNVLFNGLASPKDLNEYNEKGEVTSFGMGLNPRAGIAKNFQEPFDAAYGIGGEAFGFSPMPGITDVSVKSLNRGSLKKATINIKAHNKNQLDIIDVLYMRLGYTVLLEWGYDKYIGNDGKFETMGPTLIEKEFFNSVNNSTDYTKWLPLIEDEREAKAGNYEAMFGIISNFSWTFESNGSYSVKIDIMSMGDVIESLKANVPLADKTIITRESVKESKQVQQAISETADSTAISTSDFKDKYGDEDGFILDQKITEAEKANYYSFTAGVFVTYMKQFTDIEYGTGSEKYGTKTEGRSLTEDEKRKQNEAKKYWNGGELTNFVYFDDHHINEWWYFILDSEALWEIANEGPTKKEQTPDGKWIEVTYDQALKKHTETLQKQEKIREDIITNQVTLLKNSKLAYLFFGIREVGEK